MSKALVLKNVNFSTNALDQVTLIEDTPCTAIVLSDSTKSLDSLTPVTLTATLTPSNTTDDLTWGTSDATIATVASGVVTPLQAGTVTITANCGAQSASCEFTIRAFIDAELGLHYYLSPKNSSDVLDTVSIGGSASSNNYAATLDLDGSGRYAFDSDGLFPNNHVYPIALPTGAKSIRVTVPNQSMKVSASWCKSSVASEYGNNYIKCVQSDGNPWSSSITAGTRTISVPNISGVDCFYLSIYLSGTTITQEMIEAITVEALYS